MSDTGAASDAADWELASAYLDDDLDPTARARVERTADVLAKVDELRAVQAALAAPLPPARRGREAAIAAALAALPDADASSGDGRGGRQPAAVAVADLATARRRRLAWTTAAAAVIIVVVAIVALRGGTGRPEVASRQAPIASAARTFGTEEAAAGAAPADATPPTLAASATTIAASATIAAATGPASGSAAATQAAAPAAAPAVPQLDSPEQLRALPRPFAAATPAADSGTAAPAAGSASSPSCLQAPAVLLAVVVYRGRTAIAVVDDVRGVRSALDATTCEVLAEVDDTP